MTIKITLPLTLFLSLQFLFSAQSSENPFEEELSNTILLLLPKSKIIGKKYTGSLGRKADSIIEINWIKKIDLVRKQDFLTSSLKQKKFDPPKFTDGFIFPETFTLYENGSCTYDQLVKRHEFFERAILWKGHEISNQIINNIIENFYKSSNVQATPEETSLCVIIYNYKNTNSFAPENYRGRSFYVRGRVEIQTLLFSLFNAVKITNQ